MNLGELIRLRSGQKADALDTIAKAADAYKSGDINAGRFVVIVGQEIGMEDPPLPDPWKPLYEKT